MAHKNLNGARSRPGRARTLKVDLDAPSVAAIDRARARLGAGATVAAVVRLATALLERELNESATARGELELLRLFAAVNLPRGAGARRDALALSEEGAR